LASSVLEGAVAWCGAGACGEEDVCEDAKAVGLCEFAEREGAWRFGLEG
jgi:hypothetical protein